MSKGPGRIGTRVGRIRDWLGRQTGSWIGRLSFLWFRRYMQASKNSGASTTAYFMLSVVPTALVAVALFGWLPRAAVAGPWAVLGAMWVVVVAGDALHLPSWLLDALPFSATPYQPAEPFAWSPILLLTLVAAVLFVAGVGRFRRRDVQPA